MHRRNNNHKTLSSPPRGRLSTILLWLSLTVIHNIVYNIVRAYTAVDAVVARFRCGSLNTRRAGDCFRPDRVAAVLSDVSPFENTAQQIRRTTTTTTIIIRKERLLDSPNTIDDYLSATRNSPPESMPCSENYTKLLTRACVRVRIVINYYLSARHALGVHPLFLRRRSIQVFGRN